jgi:hypothetical protein
VRLARTTHKLVIFGQRWKKGLPKGEVVEVIGAAPDGWFIRYGRRVAEVLDFEIEFLDVNSLAA